MSNYQQQKKFEICSLPFSIFAWKEDKMVLLLDQDKLSAESGLFYYIYVPRRLEEKFYHEVSHQIRNTPSSSQLEL
jgi:hypothetical protein